ncbi:hypothetical protein HY621_02910 [Candidatus Uhrbacteria bacterium]|nr:hypothetical protein [Candidatus Uhrbacteria bacterium]
MKIHKKMRFNLAIITTITGGLVTLFFFYGGNTPLRALEHIFLAPLTQYSLQSDTEQVPMSVTILPSVLKAEDGSIDFYSLGVSPVSVLPQTPKTGVLNQYEIKFPTEREIPVGGMLKIYFPVESQFTNECSTKLQLLENNDINGQSPGIVTISTITCAASAHTVTVVIGGAAIRSGDYVTFFLQGIMNPAEARDYSTYGYSVGIETRTAANTPLEIKTSLPFFLSPSGSQEISGTIFNDNGSGIFGFARDNTKNGSEPGIAQIDVCLWGEATSQCEMTDANGFYKFTGLTDGFYTVSVPPISSGDLVGGPYFTEVTLAGNMSKTDLDFSFRPAEQTITVHIFDIPAETDITVFASYTGGSADGGGYAIRNILWDGHTTRNVSIPVSDGVWDIGIDSASTMSNTFLSPKPQQIEISGTGSYYASFVLIASNKKIMGKVVDTAGEGIPNVFVIARLSSATADIGKQIVTQSLADGTFELHVSTGMFVVSASMPGMPSTNEIEITVKEDSRNSAKDNNSTADVYSKGTLITNDGDNGADNMVFTLAKGGYAISGKILDSTGDPIANAYVSAEEIDAQGDPKGAFVDAPSEMDGSFTLFVSNGIWKLRGFAPSFGELQGKTVTIVGKNVSGQNIKISSSDFGTVEGRVTKGGRAVEGAFVSIFGPAGSNTTTTDGNGNYSMRAHAGAEYALSVFDEGSGNTAPIENLILLGNSTLRNQNFSIQTPGTIVVSIPNVSDAYVTAFNEEGQGDSTGSNPTQGTYSISVPPGIYTIAAHTPTYGSLGETSAQVNSGKITRVTFSLPSTYSISGTLISSTDPICIDNASLSALDTFDNHVITAETDAAGAYTFTVPDGVYILNFSKPGCVDTQEPATLTVNGKNMTVTPRTLNRSNSLVTGKILLDGEHIRMNTKVFAQNTDGTLVAADVDNAKTSGDNYAIALTPGMWVIRARTEGYESSAHTVTITSENTTLHMNLAKIPGYTPAERLTTPVIPSRGGIIKNADVGEKFVVTIPAGVLGNSSQNGSVSTKITTAIVTQTPTARVLGGKGIEIAPKDSSGNPITTLSVASRTGVKLTVPYSEREVVALNGDESKLVLAVWSEEKQQWEALATTVDTKNNTLSAIPPHFSIFAPIISTQVTVSPQSAPSNEITAIPTATNQSSIQIVLGTPLPPQNTRSPIPHVPVEPSNKKEPLPLFTPEPTVIFKNNEDTQNQILPIITGTQKKESALPLTIKKVHLIDTQKKEIVKPIDRNTERTPQTPTPHLADNVPVQNITVKSAPPKSTPLPQDLFEVSIALDEKDRIKISDGTLTIRGEIIKGVGEKQSIPIQFIIQNSKNEIVGTYNETYTVTDRILFEKTFTLGKNIPPDSYTISVVAWNRGTSSTFSDSFQIGNPVPKNAQPLQKTVIHTPQKSFIPLSGPIAFIILFFALAIWQLFPSIKTFFTAHR